MCSVQGHFRWKAGNSLFLASINLAFIFFVVVVDDVEILQDFARGLKCYLHFKFTHLLSISIGVASFNLGRGIVPNMEWLHLKTPLH